jgi:hypothetical protein
VVVSYVCVFMFVCSPGDVVDAKLAEAEGGGERRSVKGGTEAEGLVGVHGLLQCGLA